MINKLYENIKEFIKENYLWLLFYVLFIATMIYPLPYYIYTGGGIINIESKINVDVEDTSESGSFNMCYVSEIKSTLPTFILANIIPGWDIIAAEEIVLSENESSEDVILRDKIYLEEANQNAIKVAYTKANRKFEITNQYNYIIYVDPKANTDLRIGDQIIKVDGIKINTIEDIGNIVSKYDVGKKLEVLVRRNGKNTIKYAEINIIDGKKILGIAIQQTLDYETEPEIEFSFSNSESGPSGGLMISLAIYNKLVDQDITRGLKISGTGTIDIDGNVGEIGGVKYKLKGAVKAGSDIFLVPNGDNYDECMKLQKKHNYDIKIVGVSTFDEALSFLNNY